MAEGVDYSHSRPDPACLFDAGKRFVVRYVGPNTSSGKWLREPEKDALRAAGLSIALVYQTTADFMLQGRDRGIQAANEAKAMADGLGIVGRPIYNALDIDPRGLSDAQWNAVKAYLDGFASVLGRNRTGLYGGLKAIDVLCPTFAPWGWQTYAWSAGKWSDKAQLRQYLNGQNLCGGELDLCRSMTPDFGQWPAPGGFLMALTDTQQNEIYAHIVGDGRLKETLVKVREIHGETVGPPPDARLAEVTLGVRDLLARPATPPIDVDALAAAIVAAMPPGSVSQATVEAGVRAVIPEISAAVIAEIAS